MRSRTGDTSICGWMRRHGVFALAAMAVAIPLPGQELPRGGFRGRETRLTLGWTGDAPREFNPQRCGSPVGISLGAGFLQEFAPRVWWGGRADVHYANPFKRENCFFGGTEEPIPAGAHATTREEVSGGVPQYQFVSLSALAALEPLTSSVLRARVYGGIGAVAFEPVFPRLYGVELLPGRQTRFAISLERSDMRLKLDSVRYDYLSGVVQQRTPRGFTKHHVSTVVRISMVTGFGGREGGA